MGEFLVASHWHYCFGLHKNPLGHKRLLAPSVISAKSIAVVPSPSNQNFLWQSLPLLLRPSCSVLGHDQVGRSLALHSERLRTMGKTCHKNLTTEGIRGRVGRCRNYVRREVTLVTSRLFFVLVKHLIADGTCGGDLALLLKKI